MALVGACVLLFTVGAPLSHWGGLPGRFLLLPALAFLLPSMAWSIGRGGLRGCFPSSRLDGMNAFSAVALIAGGSSAALGLAGILSWLPGIQGQEPALRDLVLSVEPGWRLFYFALVPALCEESLFRGALLRSLRSWGLPMASVASALTFAALHASWARFVPVALLGWALALAVARTGNFWVAVAGHALHNAAILGTVGLEGDGSGQLPFQQGLGLLAGGLLLVALGLALKGKPQPARRSTD